MLHHGGLVPPSQMNDWPLAPRGRRFRPGSCSSRRCHSARAVMALAGLATTTACGFSATGCLAALAAALSSARLGDLRTGSLAFLSTVRRHSLHETCAASRVTLRLDPVRPHCNRFLGS